MSSGKAESGADETKAATVENDEVECPVGMPIVVVSNGSDALEWYPRALGGRVACRYEDKDERVLHAIVETDYGLKFGVEDHFPEEHVSMVDVGKKGTTYVYVTIPPGKGTADGAIEQMQKAGAHVVEAASDKHYGHRMGKVVDKFGVCWIFAHQISTPSPPSTN